MSDFVDVDARPILRAAGEPFSLIMNTLETLAPGQGLRLLATFRPVPLFTVMLEKGFSHQEKALANGEWEILFTPTVSVGGRDLANEVTDKPSSDEWPEPEIHLDNRDLDPPEPMIRILAAAETLSPGTTLSATLMREPVFLFPQLEQRGFRWLGGFSPDGKAYELIVRART